MTSRARSRASRRALVAPLAAFGVLAVFAASPGVSGCSKAVGGGSGPGGSGSGGGPTSVGPLLSTPVTMHRLTRFEYSNTVRDLLGEATSMVSELPSDQDNALGYDNDGASLVTSPLLVDRYASLASQLVASLFGRLHPIGQAFTNIIAHDNALQPCSQLQGLQAGVDVCGTINGGYSSSSSTKSYWGMISAYPGLQVTNVSVPAYGTYSVSVQAFATPTTSTQKNVKPPATPSGQPYPVVMGILVDGKEQTFDLTAVSSPQPFAFATALGPGQHTIEVRSDPDHNDPDNQDGNWYSQSLWVTGLRIDGPEQAPGAIKASDLLSCGNNPADSDACMLAVLQNFANRAWRRPATTAEVAALKAIADTVTQDPTETGTADQKFQDALGLALQAALLSPSFIYRPELDPDPNATGSHPLSDYELASRLSYFLWSSMPDDELFARAADGTLHTPAQLDAEVERMLGDPKASALTQGFAGQWLFTNRVPSLQPDPLQFPTYSSDVKAAMVTETQLFFQEFLKNGRKLTDMFDADFTFVNSTLAGFYGITGATGATTTSFVQVALDGTHRGGLLTQGSILTVTSHANRTSPVLRGKFVLGQLLCQPPPPPPANIPPFNEDTTAGSVRQRLEAHLSPSCASCHGKMDPIGFAMENFDGVGLYRTTDGKFPIDTSGLTFLGQTVTDVASISGVLKGSTDMATCVVRQLFDYAVGQQSSDPTDETTIAGIVSQTAGNGYALRDVIHAIVQSPAFTTRSGGAQ